MVELHPVAAPACGAVGGELTIHRAPNMRRAPGINGRSWAVVDAGRPAMAVCGCAFEMCQRRYAGALLVWYVVVVEGDVDVLESLAGLGGGLVAVGALVAWGEADMVGERGQ